MVLTPLAAELPQRPLAEDAPAGVRKGQRK
jgi:hypothetical protein